MAAQWFVSHPSGGRKHTPTFFFALEQFQAQHPELKLVYPYQEAEQEHLTRQNIEASKLVVVEVSLASTGSGIELGWANAAGKPIVAFHQASAQHSPALNFITDQFHAYITEEDIVKALGQLAQAH
jgi:nucleoside 2-deoxyribosyltransferase